MYTSVSNLVTFFNILYSFLFIIPSWVSSTFLELNTFYFLIALYHTGVYIFLPIVNIMIYSDHLKSDHNIKKFGSRSNLTIYIKSAFQRYSADNCDQRIKQFGYDPPDQDLNCLQRLLTDDTNRYRV